MTMSKGGGRGSYLREKTHCSRGHEYTTDNTRWTREKDGYLRRVCRACVRDDSARRQALRRARRVATFTRSFGG